MIQSDSIAVGCAGCYVHLLDDRPAGEQQLSYSFHLSEEDLSGRRLTVAFDPGKIPRDLDAEPLGPPVRVVTFSWNDAEVRRPRSREEARAMHEQKSRVWGALLNKPGSAGQQQK